MEPADVQAAAAGEAVAGQAVARVACARCRGDLSRVPVTARFCPRCGAALGAEAVGPDRADVLRRLEIGLGPGRDAHAHSAMIDGYASALYQLGQRYEVGIGPNSCEAMRCYLKAARLGNLPALGRLAAACVEKARAAEGERIEPGAPGETTPA